MDDKLAAKLRTLADAAKYDASCASSGAPKRSAGVDGLGSTSNGICHAYTPDGRCISLLKILLTNYCLFDCAYCINRRSSNVKRARFTVDEVVSLTVNFYKRNYIEGLFLSSGIIRSPDYTMEQMMLVAKKLRREQGFAGYIHLKTIPEASPWLIEQAGRWADVRSARPSLGHFLSYIHEVLASATAPPRPRPYTPEIPNSKLHISGVQTKTPNPELRTQNSDVRWGPSHPPQRVFGFFQHTPGRWMGRSRWARHAPDTPEPPAHSYPPEPPVNLSAPIPRRRWRTWTGRWRWTAIRPTR